MIRFDSLREVAPLTGLRVRFLLSLQRISGKSIDGDSNRANKRVICIRLTSIDRGVGAPLNK